MGSEEAIDIINRERLLLERWVDQDTLQQGAQTVLIKDREITRCLLNLTEAARYAPPKEAAVAAAMTELAQARLNYAR
jgi:hypothetical protein